MNILIITPFYQIEGRPELFQDTCAVHFLIRPWTKEHNVKIIYIYKNKFHKALRYLKKKARDYYRAGYKYQTDGVDVFMIEVQKIYRQGLWIDQHQGHRVKRMVREYLNNQKFEPDLVVTHMPTETDGMIGDMFSSVLKVAVLHSTDILTSKQSPKRYELMEKNHDCFYTRSAAIREYFSSRKLYNLQEELIHSGVPGEKVTHRIKKKPSTFRIMYAGKLVERKHVDLVIMALAKIQDEYSFTFDVYGAGKEERKLQELAGSLLGDVCSFHGQVSRDDILSAMSDSDVFVMASTRETLGLVYIEAMSRGCIPIGVKGEGIDGTIVDGENGFLVQANSIESIEKTLRSIFDMDDATYINIIKHAEEAGAFFNEEDMGYRYLKLITSYEVDRDAKCFEEQAMYK